MEWVWLTLLAALMQAVRTAGQKQLALSVDVVTVSWVRFLFGLPFAVILFAWLVPDAGILQRLPGKYWLYVLIVALGQLLATLFAVMLLGRRNFAVGSTLVKSEAAFTALLGLILFSEHLAPAGWLAVLMGIAGLFIASMERFGLDLRTILARLDSRSALLGLGGGILFGVASVFIRQANLMLGELGAPLGQAVITLCCVLVVQSLVGGVFAISTQRDCLNRIRTNLPVCVFIGLTSMLGSFGWFGAYAFQNAAYVKTLGQVEFAFTLLLTWHWFRERINPHEYLAMALICASAVIVVWQV